MNTKLNIFFNKISKSNVYQILSNGKTFIIFAFMNSFFPIFLCIISAFVPKYGAQVVMGVGYVSPFQLGFMQLSVSFATWIFYCLINRYKNKQKVFDKVDFDRTLSSSIYLSILMGIIICVLYVACAYSYMYFSCDRPNTQQTLHYGYDYINTSLVYVLLVCVKSVLVLYVYYYFKNVACYFEIGFMIISLVMAYALGVPANLGGVGVGLGPTLTIILYIAILLSFIACKCSFKMSILSKHTFKEQSKDFLMVLKESTGNISMSLFKGIALLCLGIIIPDQLRQFVPLSYQMARVIWFNLMYALPFLAYGISNAIEFYDIYSNAEHEDLYATNKLRKRYWILVTIAIAVTIILSISFTFIVEPLASLYIQNAVIVPGMIPPVEGLPIDLTILPPSSLPPIPLDLVNTIKEMKVASKSELLKLIPQFVKQFKEWVETPIMEEWKNWFDSQSALKEAFQKNPSEVAPLLADWLINYIKFCTMDSQVINALINHRTSAEIANQNSLLLYALHFNAKTYIYIAIYSILCAGWTILLPCTKKISKKSLPHWLIGIVYALAIGFVITFGVIFSLYFNVWWPNATNPFMYMDAWTFPAMLVAIVVSLYIWTKWIVVCIKDYKIEKKQTKLSVKEDKDNSIKNINKLNNKEVDGTSLSLDK